MKHIIAFVKQSQLHKVTLALHDIQGLSGATISHASGFGRGRSADADKVTDFIPRIRIDVFCTDELVEQVLNAIERAAHTGLRGDGKIYVLPVEEAIRISTDERGDHAV